MNTILIRNIQRTQLRSLQLAINEFIQKSMNFTFRDKAEALGEINEIEEGIKYTQKCINGIRRDARIIGFTRKQRINRSAEFESELGRIGQMRGELSMLQNQLSQLEESIFSLKRRILGAMNSPLNLSSNVLDHLKELKEKKDSYKNLTKIVSQHPKEDLLESGGSQKGEVADLMLASAALAAIIVAFLKRSR